MTEVVASGWPWSAHSSDMTGNTFTRSRRLSGKTGKCWWVTMMTTLTHCWFNAGPLSQTVDQHYISNGWTYHVPHSTQYRVALVLADFLPRVPYAGTALKKRWFIIWCAGTSWRSIYQSGIIIAESETLEQRWAYDWCSGEHFKGFTTRKPL